MSGQLVPAVLLDKYAAHKALEALRTLDEDDEVANALWDRIHRRWTVRGMNNTIVLQLSRDELSTMRGLGATTKPRVVEYRYVAIYKHQSSGVEVRLKTVELPPKKKTLRVPGRGNAKFVRIKLYKIINRKKESIATMATRTRKTKARDEVDEIDELEGLEELEGIEADEDEDEDEDEEPAPKRRSRSKAKPAAKPARKRRAKVVEEEPEDEDEDDEEEDEDEEEAPKKRTRSRKSAPAAKPVAKKGKSKGGPAAGRTTKEITGGVGSAELAEAASDMAELEITGRDVRVWLRKNEIAKDEESGRYTWPSEKNKTFVGLAKKIAKDLGE